MFKRNAIRLLDLLIALTVVVTVWHYVAARANTGRGAVAAPPLQSGSLLRLRAIDWSASDRTVLLLASPTCPACNESGHFYRAVATTATSSAGTRFLAIAAEPPTDVRRWLRDNSIGTSDVLQVDRPGTLGFFVVPTLLIVDNNGMVTDVMANKLTEAEERLFLARLSSPSTTPRLNNAVAANELAPAEFEQFIATERALVLDLKDRIAYKQSPRRGAVNIPLDELTVRGPMELPSTGPIAIDCTGVTTQLCRQAGMFLAAGGTRRVSISAPVRAE